MAYHHFHLDKLTQFSLHLEDLCADLLSWRDDVPAELVDEIAITAGEIMLLLADHSHDELVCGTLGDARRLREVARTLQPQRAVLVEAGAALTKEVAQIIREEKQAS